MNYIYHISSIATTFGALSKMTFLGQKCIPILGMRLKNMWNPNRNNFTLMLLVVHVTNVRPVQSLRMVMRLFLPKGINARHSTF